MRPQLTHLGVYSSNLDGMEKFYKEVLNLMVTDRGHVQRLGGVKIVFMSANPGSHHQFVMIEKTDMPGQSTINQISFRVDGLPTLREVYKRLSAAGTGAIHPVSHGNAWSIYGSDPDGNGIEVYTDTPWYVAQPHGKPLDLGLTDEEIYRTTEAAVRTDPTFRPVGEWAEDFRQKL